jgi:hypothetical protein
MPGRLFSVPGRFWRTLLVLALVLLPLLQGCTETPLQDAAAGRGTEAMDFVIFCATFHVCGF